MINIFGQENTSSGLSIHKGFFTKKNVDAPNLILHLLSGRVRVSLTDNSYTMQNQDILICGNNDIQLESTDKDTYLLVYQLSNQLLNSYSGSSPITFETKMVNHREAAGQKLNVQLNKIISYIRQEKGQLDFRLVALSFEALQTMIDSFSVSRTINKHPDNRIFDVLLYIENHYSSVITLDEIASQFGFSAAYFSRYFKKHTGSNFLDYLTDYRLEKAAKTIIRSYAKISEIAAQEGFSNINSFNKKFKERYGCTPKEFRQSNFQKEELSDQAASNDMFDPILDQVSLNTDTQRFEIMDSTPREVNLFPWKRIVNIGSAEDLLRFDLRTHVRYLKENLEFQYVRFWNLFTKRMNMDPSITTKYNFEKIDSVLDFIVNENLRPFIELRYKIRKIHRSVRETLILENEDFKFSLNSEEWFDMIHQFMKHVNNRYGRKEVNKWMFEFSFEYYQDKKELDELISHYKKTYQIIRKSNSIVQIGGPGTRAQNDEVFNYQDDLNYFYQKDVNFDFISCLVYPYLVRTGGERKSVRVENDNFLVESVSEVKKAIENSPYQGTELIITEWNNTISNRNAMNDSLFKGSYLIKNFAAIMSKIDGIVYWLGSDLFSEFIDSRDVLHGGAGLIAKGGIPKPVFHAFRFMNFLNENVLLNEGGVIVSKEEEHYGIIAHNYLSPSTEYYLVGEEEVGISDLNQFFSNGKDKNIELIFSFEAGKKFEVKTFRVNEEHGNIISGWKDISYRSSLTSKDLEYLMLVAAPKISIKQIASDLKGQLLLKEKLTANEFMYITIRPIEE